MAGATAQIEAAQLMLPESAPWLAEFKAEIRGFPNFRHDDQADALTQLMSWMLRNGSVASIDSFGTPILFMCDKYGWIQEIGGDNDGACHSPTSSDEYW